LAFEGLAEKLQRTFGNLRGRGKLTEKDVKEAMREVKLALLEADVNFKIVKDFINKVTERAIGQDILTSLTPDQTVIKIVKEELTELMGTTQRKLIFSSQPPTVIMMTGLQGSGKTTTTGKLGGLLKNKMGKNPLLVACDVYRPAAIKQLQVVGESLGLPVFAMGDKVNPVDIAKAGLEHAKKMGNDVVIIDTAGRLHIDEALMEELVQVKAAVKPTEILLVIDSMTGQDAVNVAQSFNDTIGVDGIVLTKLDGDTRGGAALSVRAVTGKPIKFAGMGEKLTDLEEFHPDRMAGRILGMGDILSLIEKAQTNMDETKAKEMEQKLRNAEFNFEDFLDQMEQMKKMGPLGDIIKMIPGMNEQALKDINIDEREIARNEAIIRSMTRKERIDPSVLNASRKKRIASGSGMQVADVNRLLKQFDQTKKMMKQMSGMEKKMKKGRGFGGGLKLPFM
jgi:signal recognition particle subunit SRP54